MVTVEMHGGPKGYAGKHPRYQTAVYNNKQDRFEGMGMLAFTSGGHNTSLILLLVVLHLVPLEAWVVGAGPSPSPSKGPTRKILPQQQPVQPARRGSLVLRAFSADDDDEMFGESPAAEQEELTDEQLAETMEEWDDRIARYNTIHLTGRIGNDPEPRYFDDGKVVVNLSLACRRKYHSMERKLQNIQSGEEETDWYGLEIWGQTAEFVSRFVDKGARVGVIGQLQVDTWEDRETGEPRNRAKVVVRDFDVLETRAEAELRRGGSSRRSFLNDDDDDDDYSPRNAGTGGFFDT